MHKWIALGEIAVGNLAWIGALDLEGWLLATGVAVGIGAAVWLLAGPWWLVLGTSLYLGLLVCVKLLANRGRD